MYVKNIKYYIYIYQLILFNILKKYIITLLRVIPTLAFHVIYSDIYFDILPNILLNIYSDILSGISSSILSGNPCELRPKLYCPKMEYLFFLRFKGSPSFYKGFRPNLHRYTCDIAQSSFQWQQQ